MCAAASRRWRPGLLLHVLGCAELPPATENYLVPNLNNAKLEETDLGVLTLQLTQCRDVSGLQLLPSVLTFSVPLDRIVGVDPKRRSGPLCPEGDPGSSWNNF